MKLSINHFLKYFQIEIKKIVSKDLENEFLANLSEDLVARQSFLKYYGINLLLDVGANTGQFASLMRRIGYDEKIVSFEPLSTAFVLLQSNSIHDEKWICENFALGNEDSELTIHVSKNSYSSSILDILPSHISYDEESKYISDEIIKIKRLDDIFQNYYKPYHVVMLKIDTQGFERFVIDGANNSLKHILFLQLEISIEPLYKDETLFTEMLMILENKGFELFSLENGIRDSKSGKLLQVDGIFINKNLKINEQFS